MACVLFHLLQENTTIQFCQCHSIYIVDWMETGAEDETTSHSKTNLTYFSVMAKLNQVG